MRSDFISGNLVPSSFLKTVTQVLLSQVSIAFALQSVDFELRLKPRSALSTPIYFQILHSDHCSQSYPKQRQPSSAGQCKSFLVAVGGASTSSSSSFSFSFLGVTCPSSHDSFLAKLWLYQLLLLLLLGALACSASYAWLYCLVDKVSYVLQLIFKTSTERGISHEFLHNWIGRLFFTIEIQKSLAKTTEKLFHKADKVYFEVEKSAPKKMHVLEKFVFFKCDNVHHCRLRGC